MYFKYGENPGLRCIKQTIPTNKQNYVFKLTKPKTGRKSLEYITTKKGGLFDRRYQNMATCPWKKVYNVEKSNGNSYAYS